MGVNEIHVAEMQHPNGQAEEQYQQLVGIDTLKQNLLDTLSLLLNTEGVSKWQKKHHPKGLDILNQLETGTPLIILSGEVGCGKTALAQSIATPLAKKLGGNGKIWTYETPSNIRGVGMVGEISNRITAVFDIVKQKLKQNIGILIIDEGDDLATSRAQNQAHHEDRAGLNVLIKQLDLIKRSGAKLAVILITNRLGVLDPAIRRRASLELSFERPNDEALKMVFQSLFGNSDSLNEELADFIVTAKSKEIPYSFSDLIHKVGRQALFKAISTEVPFSASLYKSILIGTEPSPLIAEMQKIQ
jgi:SpoVK/Ycf46/Vps4 family AAA+-type ATPase